MDKFISEMSYHELLREFLFCSELSSDASHPEHVYYSHRAAAIKNFIDENFDRLYNAALDEDMNFISNFGF